MDKHPGLFSDFQLDLTVSAFPPDATEGLRTNLYSFTAVVRHDLREALTKRWGLRGAIRF